MSHPTQPSEGAEIVRELIDESGDLHNVVHEATIDYLGEVDPPLDGLYWAVYHRIQVQYLLEATHLLPISFE